MFIIEFILGILTIPLVFWCLFLVECYWLMWATEEESLSGAFWATLFAGSLFIVEYGSFSGVYHAIKANPMIVGIALLTYMIVGTAWSTFKWYLYVGKVADNIKETIDNIGREKAAEKLSYYDNGDKNTQKILDTNFMCLAPDVKKHKHKITTWILLWVPSATWFILNDPLRRTANWIYDRVKGIFQSISDKVFKSAFKPL